MVFLVGVVGLDAAPLWEGGAAVKEDDSGLFCNGTVVPGALPFDRRFGDEGVAFGLGFALVLAGFDVMDANDGGGRRGDLGGEGGTLDTGGEASLPSTSMASSLMSSGAITETEEGFLDLIRFVGLEPVSSLPSLSFVDEAVEPVFLCPLD